MEIDDLEMQEIDNIFNDAYKKTKTLREAWRYAMMRYAEIYHDREVKKLNEPAVINNEASDLSERVAVCCQTCKYVDGIRCNEVNGGCELDEYECWEQQTDL